MPTAENDLATALENNDWPVLEEKWLTLSEEEPGRVSLYRRVLEKLLEIDQENRAREMTELMVNSWQDRDHTGDTYDLMLPLVRKNLLPDHLEDDFREAIRERYDDHPALRTLLQKSGLDREITAENLETFEELVRFTPGTYVYHSSGWGTGRIRRIRRSSGKLEIDFQERAGHQMSLEAAANYVNVIPEKDPRSLYFEGEETLRESLHEEPEEIVGAYLQARNRDIELKELRSLLKDFVFSDSQWTSWWNKVRPKLMKHPNIDLSGRTRPDLEYRESEKTPDRELEEKLKYEDRPEGVRSTVRNFMSFIKNNENIRKSAKDALRDKFEYFRKKAHEGKHRSEFVQLLLYLDRKTNLVERDQIEELIGDVLFTDGNREDRVRRITNALGELQSARDIGIVLDVIEEQLDETGAARLQSELLLHVNGSLWTEVIDRLVENDRREYIAEALYRLTGLPGKHPLSFISMVRYRNRDAVQEIADFLPSELELFRNLIELAEATSDRYLPDDYTVRQMTREIEGVLKKNDAELIESVVPLMDRETTRDLRDRVKRLRNVKDTTRAAILSRMDDIEEEEEKAGYFWESELLFSTEEGIEKRQKEYQELVEEKLPANRKAVKKAREMGDVSENAELDAALEERSLLTSRAQKIKGELDRARSLSEVDLEEGIVQPGTAVSVVDTETGEERHFRILGPWDVDEHENTISYETPIAQGLLGAEPGDECTVDLPEGTHTYRVEDVDIIL